MVASTSTATAMPNPKSLSARSGPSTNAPNTQTMIAAAAVITRAVDREAVGDRGGVVAGAVVLLLDAAEEEHLVVHRQAEHDGEHHQRRPRLDRSLLPDAEQARAPAPLEHRDHQAVRDADGEQVHHHRLQRHQDRAEHHHQQQERQQQHDAHDDGQHLERVRGEVADRRGQAADRRVERRARDRVGMTCVAEAVDEIARALVLRRRASGRPA